MNRTSLSIFHYTEYRTFLRDRLDELRRQDARYSRRYFVRRLGLASSNYLKRIIEGSRNVSSRLAPRLADVLGLGADEASFFLDLIRYEQAKDTPAREAAIQHLRRRHRFVEVHRLDLGQFDYCRDPLLVSLREMVDLGDFEEDPDWIASRLTMRASRRRIADGLARLQASGHLVRDETGRLRAAHQHQRTGDRLGSVPLRAYHLNMLEAGSAAIELPVDQRHFLGLSFSIPTAEYEAVVAEMRNCLDRIRSIVDAPGPSEQVYHLEMVLFPLTRRVEPCGPSGEGPEREEPDE